MLWLLLLPPPPLLLLLLLPLLQTQMLADTASKLTDAGDVQV